MSKSASERKPAQRKNLTARHLGYFLDKTLCL